jgi:cholesterol transport system auxiliary component
MRRLFILLLVTLLSGCVGIKARPSQAVYDFGLTGASENEPQIASQFLIEDISAPESLNSNRITYRLSYENAVRVYSYTESRWLAPPAKLLTHRLRFFVSAELGPQSCTLKMQLAVFEHVFDSPTASKGVVIIFSELVNTKTRKPVMSQRIEESVAAQSQDARGGVAALKNAGEKALINTLAWGKSAATASSACY